MKLISAKKSLGQNFLTDKNISNKIVSLLDIQEGDLVIEIGPGTGALTSIMLESKAHITSIEIDNRAIDVLQAQFGNKENFTLIEGDFLKMDLKEICKEYKSVKIIGNIPYYITGDIIFKILENASLFHKMVMMVQKEVADRIVSNYGNKVYGVISVACAFRGKVKKSFDVSPNCFIPKPNVWSSVFSIDFFENQLDERAYSTALRLVKSTFNQRRKKISNSIMNYLSGELDLSYLDKIKADEKFATFLDLRAEQLSPQDFIDFNNFIISSK